MLCVTKMHTNKKVMTLSQNREMKQYNQVLRTQSKNKNITIS